MTTHSGVDGAVTVSGNTVAEIKGFSVDESANTFDDSNLNDAAETHIVGRTSWNGSIECHWDEGDTTGQEAMTIGATITVVLLPEGNTSGDVSLSGTATITARALAVADQAVISQTFTLKGNGALTRSTVA